MKFLIMDAGPFISLTLNGMLYTLEKLKENFPQINIIITPQVKNEVINKPMNIKKYKLEAIKVQDLIDKKIINLSTDFVDNNKLEKETRRISSLSNSIFKAQGEKLKLIHEGEASCLAFSNLCNAENLIVVDERAVRLLTEAPENLQKISEKKLHMKVDLDKKTVKEFSKFRFIRSTELVYIAYKNNLYNYKKDKQLLDALLYSLKYSGTSISGREIEEIKNLG